MSVKQGYSGRRPKPYKAGGFVMLSVAFAGALSLTGLLVGTPAQAGNMYVFKDKKGNTLLTNVVGNNKKPKGKQFSGYGTKVKVTWYKDTNVHTYNDWGKSEASVLPSYSKNKNAFDAQIQASAARHGVDAELMKAIMHTESSFNPRARSPVGAQGLMQLMPATARRFRVVNAWNPAQNIEGSAKYLKYLKKRFKGNTSLMLAGYNAGEGNVDKYGGIPPFKETQNYVKKVLSRYHKLYKGSLGGSISASSSTNMSGITVFTPSSSASKLSNSISNVVYSTRNQNQPATRQSDQAYDASAFAALKEGR